MHEGSDTNVFTFQEAIQIEQEAHRLEQERKQQQEQKQEEKRKRMGLALPGEKALSRAEQEARIYAFMYVCNPLLRHNTPNPPSSLSGLINQPNQTSKMTTRKMTLMMTTPPPGLTTTKMTAVKDRISSSQITKTCPTSSALTRVVFPRTISTSAKGNDQPSNVPILYHAEFQH